MPAERRAELLEHFYATQLQIIDCLGAYMVPLFRYFAKELETRNTESDGEETAEANANARLSRLKAVQLKQIAKMLMEFRQAIERADKPAVELYQSQFKELMLGFDYSLLSTLASPLYCQPKQLFLLDEPKTLEVIQTLRTLVATADDDRNALFKGNWRLVMEIARRFQTFGSRLDLDEMIQEGNTGLLAAIDKFNPKLNNQLSTVAANWIQAKIRRALDNLSDTIRTPVYKRQRKKIVQRAEMELLLEAQASADAKSKDTNAPQQLLTNAERLFGRTIDDKTIATRTGLSAEEVQELRRLYPETVSIHATLDGNDDSDKQERGDLIADKSHDDEDPAHDIADKKLFFEVLGKLVDDLPLVYQVVLGGLNGLPIRKEAFKKLVHARGGVLLHRGSSLAKAQIAGKAAVQVFK